MLGWVCPPCPSLFWKEVNRIEIKKLPSWFERRGCVYGDISGSVVVLEGMYVSLTSAPGSIDDESWRVETCGSSPYRFLETHCAGNGRPELFGSSYEVMLIHVIWVYVD